MIRDAETESVLERIAAPLYQAAGYDPRDIRIFIVKDDSLNAYVSGGKNIFLNTGLLLFDADFSTVAGVMAHELGHITGSHIIRRTETAGDLTAASAAGLILGLATGAAAGPAAGTAVFSATQNALQRGYLSETRRQEESADHTAVTLMRAAGYSPHGLEKLLSHFHVRELAAESAPDPYLLSHPLSSDRLDYVRSAAAQTGLSPQHEKLAEDYRFVHAKLSGFLERPEYVLERLNPDSGAEEAGTLRAAYGAAVAFYRSARTDKALLLLDGLRERRPDNPFFDELKAQFLFETGRLDEAALLYKKAMEALPENLLLQTQYAAVLVSKSAGEEDPDLRRATHLLEDARIRGEKTQYLLRMLAVAYGKAGRIGLSNLALAERAIAAKDEEEAEKFLALARVRINDNTPAYARWRDANDALQRLKKEEKG